MASNGVSTAGSLMGWATGTSATAPKAFTKIPEIKEVPELNPEPSSLETTSLEETEYKTYTAGLKDLGGAIGFTANFTRELKEAWASAVTSANGESLWWCIKHPTMGAVAFKGKPSSLGMPAMSVDSVLEITCYVTPTSAPEWVTGEVTIAEA